ncbi:MAG: YbaN family protein [Bacteroidota bacterium]|nr:YbaN family protein [Bacteroidota bacterium]
MIKALFIILGSLFLFLGILGIFIPGLPTTPFLLLTAAMYIRGSERLYNKLIANRYVGKYIKNYRERRGMSMRQKVYSIVLMWVMITVSNLFFIENLSVRLIVIAVGLIGTIVMGKIIPTYRE